MKVIIVGYGEMLNALVEGIMKSKHDLVGVFRHENTVRTRFMRWFLDIFLPSEDFRLVNKLYIFDIKAKSVNSKKFISEVKRLNADIIIVGSWSEKFSLETIRSPKIACINTHPSLLPKYRGPNPYFQAILNGESKSGITFHLLDENFDTGNILEQIEITLDDSDTGASLKYKCTNAAAENIAELIDNLENKIQNSISQNKQDASYQKQITLSEAILDFKSENSKQIDRRIRALIPWLKSYICYNNEFISFNKYEILNEKTDKEAGTVIAKTDDSLKIACLDGNVIEFSQLSLCRSFSKLLTGIYLKYFIKINTKVS